jgi:6-phosphogluconolactonase (cycloisomerase 2 family)
LWWISRRHPLSRFLFFQFNYGSTAFDGVDTLSVNATDGTLSSNSQILQPVYEPAIDPQGRFIYWNASSSNSNAVGGLDVASSGKLTTAPGEPYTFTGQTSYGAPAIGGNYAFVTNYRDTGSSNQGELVEWTIDPATGALTQTGNNLPLQFPAVTAATPNGKFVYTQQQYLSNGSTGTAYYEIVPIQIGANGALNEITENIQQTTSQGIDMIWMSPNGNFLYMGINGNDLWDYQIDQTTGALTLVQKYTGINEGLTLAIDPSAKYMFTAPLGANHVAGTTIAVYQVDPTTGALTPLPNDTLDTKVFPVSLAVVAPAH